MTHNEVGQTGQNGFSGSDGLPEGWSSVRLSDGLVVDVQPGFACGENNRDGRGIAHLRPMNVHKEGKIDLSTLKYVPVTKADQDKRLLRRGDVIFNNTNSPELVGKTAYYDLPESKAFSNHMTRLRCQTEILDPQFCAIVLHQKWRGGYFRLVCSHHVSQSSVGRAVLLNTRIVLPPLAEQKRIVAKVEQLLARVNAARERLAKVPALLKRFRQSVLAAACSGRLTADWREENGFPEIFDRAKLKDVVDSIQIGPFGSLLHKSDYVENGIPVINPTNIANGRIRPSPHVTVTTGKKSDLGRYVLQEHDVVVGRRGEMGRCAVVRKNQTGWICGTGSLFVRPGSALLSDFLHILISSPPAIVYLESASVGSTMTNLNQKIFSNMEIGFPGVEEQHQIVRQVQRLFRLADRIQARLEEAMAYVDKLTQSILAKAFRGELVTYRGQTGPARQTLPRTSLGSPGQNTSTKKRC